MEEYTRITATEWKAVHIFLLPRKLFLLLLLSKQCLGRVQQDHNKATVYNESNRSHRRPELLKAVDQTEMGLRLLMIQQILLAILILIIFTIKLLLFRLSKKKKIGKLLNAKGDNRGLRNRWRDIEDVWS